ITSEPNRVVVKSTNLFNPSWLSIPGDISSAAFWLVAAAILPGSEVAIRGVGLNPTRTGILGVLRSFGAAVSIEDDLEVCGEPRGTVVVRPGDRRAIVVEGPSIAGVV